VISLTLSAVPDWGPPRPRRPQVPGLFPVDSYGLSLENTPSSSPQAATSTLSATGAESREGARSLVGNPRPRHAFGSRRNPPDTRVRRSSAVRARSKGEPPRLQGCIEGVCIPRPDLRTRSSHPGSPSPTLDHRRLRDHAHDLHRPTPPPASGACASDSRRNRSTEPRAAGAPGSAALPGSGLDFQLPRRGILPVQHMRGRPLSGWMLNGCAREGFQL
jgi:hypothetical protein